MNKRQPDQFHDLGSFLGMLRTRARLTQQDISRLARVSSTTIRKWENNVSVPNAEHLKQLIEVYLGRKVLTIGKEREEAEGIWTKANLNVTFDIEWFHHLQSKQLSSSNHKYAQVTARALSAQEETESSYQRQQTCFFFNSPLPNPQEFFGRIRERITLEHRTFNGASTSIVGSRKIGKTWLINYLRQVAQKKFGSQFRFGYIDAMLPICDTVEGFTVKVAQALEMPPPQGHSASFIGLEHIIADLQAHNIIPVILIDEFESFNVRTCFDLHFYRGLRALTQAGLCLITSSESPLIEIMSKQLKTSPFFNVCEQLTIEPFDQKEAEMFVETKSIQAGFTDLERHNFLKCSRTSEGEWPPLRLQLVGKILQEDKVLAEQAGKQYFQPLDPTYWQIFVQRVEDKYSAVVR